MPRSCGPVNVQLKRQIAWAATGQSPASTHLCPEGKNKQARWVAADGRVNRKSHLRQHFSWVIKFIKINCQFAIGRGLNF